MVDHWDVAVEMLRPAIDLSGYTVEHVATQLILRNMQLWMGDKFACVTEIRSLPKWKVCIIMFIGGAGVREWGDALNGTLDDWARAEGCKYIEGEGRPGWAKVSKTRGYKVVTTTLRKKL